MQAICDALLGKRNLDQLLDQLIINKLIQSQPVLASLFHMPICYSTRCDDLCPDITTAPMVPIDKDELCLNSTGA